MFLKKYIIYPLEALIAFAVFSFFKALPLDVASKIGSIITAALYPFLKPTKTARKNLKKAFPLKTDDEIETIIKKMWDNLGRNLAEFPHIPNIIQNKYKRVELIGLENVMFLKNDNNAGLFISAHFGNWEASIAATIACDLQLHRIYRTANNPLVKNLYTKGRSEKFGELIPKGAKGADRKSVG